MKNWVPLRLMWRVYAVGLAQLLATVAAGILLLATVGRLERRSDFEGLTSRLTPLLHSPALLDAELTRLRSRDGILVSLYDADGRLIASNEPHPSPRPPPGLEADIPFPYPRPAMARPDLGPPGAVLGFRGPPGRASGFGAPPGRPPSLFTHLPLGDGRKGVLAIHPEHLEPSLLPQLLTLLTGVLIVGLGAMLIARSVGKPLEQLSQAARAFGAGDLRARAAAPGNDDLGAVLATFNEMADRIQQLVLAEKELIANVAHELRTPLARIRVALELAAEGDAKVARASISEIAIDLAELETLVNDVLNTSRFEATAVAAAPPGFALHIERVAAAQIAEQAVERFRTRHPERELCVHVAPGLPELEGDPNLVRRVLDNVLENAHKYSPDPASDVVLKVSSGPNTIRFEVEDHGVGIAAEDLPRVFTAFFRAERSRSRRTGGVGLGLTLAKRIVEAHGGTISIESELGHGTCVRVELPVTIEQGGGSRG